MNLFFHKYRRVYPAIVFKTQFFQLKKSITPTFQIDPIIHFQIPLLRGGKNEVFDGVFLSVSNDTIYNS